MSLINQVLNDLDKRGASTRIGEATIRVVPVRRGFGKLWLFFATVVVAALVAVAWLKWDVEIRINSPSIVKPGIPVLVEQSPLVETNMLPVASAPLANGNVGNDSNTSAVVPKPLAIKAPQIVAVKPDPVISLGTPQTLMIVGNYFAGDVVVNLRTPAGKLYANRQIVMQDSSNIVITPNFGTLAGAWSVEVENTGGISSGQYAFKVQAISTASKIEPQNKSAPSVNPPPQPEKNVPGEQLAMQTPVGGISKQPTQITLQQQAENEFRKAYELMQKGQVSAALSGFETTLRLDAGHLMARQTLVRLLLENKRNAEAEQLLQQGLKQDIKQSSLALLLARMQVGRNALGEALETMQKSLPYAQKQAEYQAYVAALLQRQNNHKEAIIYFQNAVELNPQSGVWLMGLGISLQAEQRKDEARDAFNRALQTHSLSAELQAYVTQKIKEL